MFIILPYMNLRRITFLFIFLVLLYQKGFNHTLITNAASKNSQTSTGNNSGFMLNILEPQNGITLNNSRVRVKGKTVPNADVFVNNQELKADRQGNFTTIVTLDEGENTIFIVANDYDGNFAEKELTVYLESIK